ncbi:MAG TPA: copper amine oxidase N-terminal domain-containing protein [Candidatus Elarobacter sp.]|nr:copper amine oxidase N-terminal domain-containing protein [Candidatus Elarobacter sp.]
MALVLVVFGPSARAAEEFGGPPSGEIPILYNDHTVYAKPDVLRRSRVLAALVKGGQIYVPLRSMFEQMGATVSASADGKTVTVAKSGASASVTVGKDVVIVNGESRPLDVPPIVYHGIVLVPVRVLSEALGAYVQWVPSKRVVVVRYIPSIVPPPEATPTPQPAAVPSSPPVVVPPTPSPTPVPTPAPYRGFVQAAITASKNFNEFSAGGDCPEAYLLNAAYVFKDSPLALKVDFRQDVYLTSDNLTDAFSNHFTQFATIDAGVALTPVFLARQSSFDARLEYQIAAPKIYVGASYLHTANNYGYPQLNAAGVGIEKLPDLRPGLNVFGSAFFYPAASGTYTIADPASINAGKSYRQQYAIVKYDVGLALVFAHSPLYLHGGIAGDRYTAKQSAPIGQTHDGPYIGLGVKL